MDAFIGEIRMFPYAFAPEGWLNCDGSSLAMSGNQAVYAVIGTIYGQSNTYSFKLPNLQGLVPMGAQFTQGSTTSSNIGPYTVSGAESISLSQSQLPGHTHQMQAMMAYGASLTPNATSALSIRGSTPANSVYMYAAPPQGTSTLVTLAPQALAAVGGSAAHENRQPYLGMRFCFCTDGTFPVWD